MHVNESIVNPNTFAKNLKQVPEGTPLPSLVISKGNLSHPLYHKAVSPAQLTVQ